MPRYKEALCTSFTVWDRVQNRLRRVTRKGRIFTVGGVAIKLFEIRIMAEAIDRKPRTVTNWEREGKFPKPMFNVKGSRCKRWYSEAQIQALNEIWLRYREKGKARHFPVDDFLGEVRSVFYKVDYEAIKKAEGEEHE